MLLLPCRNTTRPERHPLLRVSGAGAVTVVVSHMVLRRKHMVHLQIAMVPRRKHMKRRLYSMKLRPQKNTVNPQATERMYRQITNQSMVIL